MNIKLYFIISLTVGWLALALLFGGESEVIPPTVLAAPAATQEDFTPDYVVPAPDTSEVAYPTRFLVAYYEGGRLPPANGDWGFQAYYTDTLGDWVNAPLPSGWRYEEQPNLWAVIAAHNTEAWPACTEVFATYQWRNPGEEYTVMNWSFTTDGCLEPPSLETPPSGTITTTDTITLTWSTVPTATAYAVSNSWNSEITTTTNTSLPAGPLADGVYTWTVASMLNGIRGEWAIPASFVIDAQPPFIEPRLWLPLVVR